LGHVAQRGRDQRRDRVADDAGAARHRARRGGRPARPPAAGDRRGVVRIRHADRHAAEHGDLRHRPAPPARHGLRGAGPRLRVRGDPRRVLLRVGVPGARHRVRRGAGMVPLSRRERAGLALLFVGALCFLGLFAHGHVENSDAEVTMHAARAWWLRGDPGLLREGPDVSVAERTLAEWIASGSPTGFGMPGRNGKAYVWFPIGHQALMVPCVALGEACARAFPAPETRLIELEGEAFGAFFWSRFFVALLPIPFAAGAVVVVWLLARTLGASGRDALVVTAAATLATAFWPGSSETMSDVPGTFFLLLAALGVFADRKSVVAGVGAPRWLLLAGGAAGAAVCVRYPHAA